MMTASMMITKKLKRKRKRLLRKSEGERGRNWTGRLKKSPGLAPG